MTGQTKVEFVIYDMVLRSLVRRPKEVRYLVKRLVKNMKILLVHLVFKVEIMFNVKPEIFIFTDFTERHD